jgi:lipoprotein-anchoring transpeptidase ErfK/SrfK
MFSPVSAQELGQGGREVISFPYEYDKGEIIVSFGDRRLYYVYKEGYALSYPIAVPKPEELWSGEYKVTDKKVKPGWTPTAKMRKEEPHLPKFVPGGHPNNPLGIRALYIGDTLYRIHGTDAPWLIGEQVSHGCIRMFNRDVVDLYERAAIGSNVTVTGKRFTNSFDGYASNSNQYTQQYQYQNRSRQWSYSGPYYAPMPGSYAIYNGAIIR